MYQILTKTEVSALSCNTMETRDHSKNGASLKSQISRVLFTIIAVIGFGVVAYAQDAQTQKENPPQNQKFILKRNGKIMVQTIAMMKKQGMNLCSTLDKELKKLGVCCVYEMTAEDEPTADVIITASASPASVTFVVFDKVLHEEVLKKTYLFSTSVKSYTRKFIKDITPFIEP